MANLASERKAKQIVVIEVKSILYITDYFVVMSGATIRQVKAIHEGILETLRERGVKPLGVEGAREGRWVLLDYGDVIAHIFVEEEREYYQLERLWQDVPVTVWEE